MVYIVQSEEYIKVGVAKDVKKRIQGIQTGNQYKLKLIGTKESLNDYELESRIHTFLSNYRVIGEWFRISENKMISLIELYKIDKVEDYSIDNDYNNLADSFEDKLKIEKELNRIRADRQIEMKLEEMKKDIMRSTKDRLSNILNIDFINTFLPNYF